MEDVNRKHRRRYSHITIDPEDIIVSGEPFSSSARNLFDGVITETINHWGKILLEVQSSEVFRSSSPPYPFVR